MIRFSKLSDDFQVENWDGTKSYYESFAQIKSARVLPVRAFCSGNDNHSLAREIFYFKPIQTH